MTENKNELYIKIFIGVTAGIFWLIYGFNDSNKTVFLWISILLTLSALGLIFGKQISEAFKNKGDSSEIPQPMTDEELKERLEKEANSNLANIVHGTNPQRRIRVINKDMISATKVLIRPDFEEKIIIINMNHPNFPSQILNGNASQSTIKTAMNDMATNPFDEPDREIIDVGFDEFKQPKKRIERIIAKKPEEKKEEETVA